MEKTRLSASDRRDQILKHASRLFSLKGHYGVTTKELASNCGITEPILYRHFTNKDHLYQEVKKCNRGQFQEIETLMSKLSPSTENFIFMTSTLVWSMVLHHQVGESHKNAETERMIRLLGFSLVEDGSMMKTQIDQFAERLMPYWLRNYQAAFVLGDLNIKEISDESLWMTFQQMTALSLFELNSSRMFVEWDTAKERLTNTTQYFLRALGIREDVIMKKFSMAKMVAKLDEIKGA
jgi:AcrR family transcriptional regulator